MLYIIQGNLTSVFMEENGGEEVVVNERTQGGVAFFPQGPIHYYQNLD